MVETVATLEAAAELAREHDEIDRLATLVSTLRAGPARRAMVLEVCSRYAAHAQAEDCHLMPALRRYLPDGDRTAAEETARHLAVARTITAFVRLCDEPQDRGPSPGESSNPDSIDESFDELDELDIVIGQVVAGIQGHVERQDTMLLPVLNRVCPLEESRQLGARLHEALCGARSGEKADGQPRRHGIKALLHFLARSLSIHTGQPAGSG